MKSYKYNYRTMHDSSTPINYDYKYCINYNSFNLNGVE